MASKDYRLIKNIQLYFQKKIVITKSLMFIAALVLPFSFNMISVANAAPTGEIAINFTYPLDNTSVLFKDTVTGTSQNIPEGETLWIVVYSYAAKVYHPQGKAQFQGENWQCSAQFGLGKDIGARFDIIAVLANQTAQNNFSDYLNKSNAIQKWDGMPKLPDGTKKLYNIKVTRVIPEVYITSPLNTAKIHDTIEGTAKNIPEGETLWIVVYPYTAKVYHPQGEAQFQGENWQCSAKFGLENDTNKQFDIIAVQADQTAQNNFSDYLNKSNAIQKWDGMPKPPDGTEKLYNITVTRLEDPLKADFFANTTSGYAPLTVQFTDSSQNSTGWNWDFGDGTTSTDQSPLHTYFMEGIYNVNLRVSNENKTDSKSATVTVSSGGSSMNFLSLLKGVLTSTVGFLSSSVSLILGWIAINKYFKERKKSE